MMQIGTHVLEYLPDSCDIPKAQKAVSTVQTYSGVQFFNWGMILPGVQIKIAWDLMSTIEFNLLNAIFEQDGIVVWVSGIQGKTYNVLISSFGGKLINGGEWDYREAIEMTLIIVSEVTS